MKTLKTELRLFTMVIAVVISLALTINSFLNMKKLVENCTANIHRISMESYDTTIKNQVRTTMDALTTMNNRVLRGELPLEAAKAAMITTIKSMRYGEDGSGYYWIDDTNYILVAHPILPQNEGQNRYNLADQNGVMIIQTIMDVVTKNKEGGFTEFSFTKADGVTVAPKRTYSQLFEPWGWIISTGNYYDDIEQQVQAQSQMLLQNVSISLVINLVIFAVALLAAFFCGLAFSRTVAKPVAKSVEALEKMNEGDLTQRLEHTAKQQEFYRMENALNSFCESLNKVISSVRHNIVSLDNVALQLDNQTETINKEITGIISNVGNLTKQAGEQKTGTEETARTMNQMIATVANLSRKIDDQSSNVSQSSASIEEMIANIHSISDNMNKFGESFKNLSVNSSQGNKLIANVIQLVKTVSAQSENLLNANKVIASVASQTNLLAMNAAIEAAHAGEAGKGFAVVADEIRKLSENTTKQSKDISSTLKEVLNVIGQVTNASNEAGTVFASIVDQIENDNAIISEIQASMTEQSEGSAQILESLNNINSITTEIQKGSAEMASDSGSVQKQISVLQDFSETLQESTGSIENATLIIQQSIASLSEMAAQNRTYAQTLSEDTEKFKV